MLLHSMVCLMMCLLTCIAFKILITPCK
jgi:hypothetical protein